METIFKFIEPYVEFSSTHYLPMFIILVIVCITILIAFIHLTKDDSIDIEAIAGMSVITFICCLAWPLCLAIIACILSCLFYYYFIGFLIKVVLKRFK